MAIFQEHSKQLPMKYPFITSYPSHANLISVLSNYQEAVPWIYNFYIQLETTILSILIDLNVIIMNAAQLKPRMQ